VATCLPLAKPLLVLTFPVMRSDRESTPAVADIHEFVVAGGCAVCEGPLSVRATPGTMRGYCARCSWISRPIVWQGNGQVSIAYPPLASA
jgi:hypothetical protein